MNIIDFEYIRESLMLTFENKTKAAAAEKKSLESEQKTGFEWNENEVI